VSAGSPQAVDVLSLCIYKAEEAVKRGLLPQEYLLYEDFRQKGKRHIDTLCEGAVRGRDVEKFSSIDEWVEWLGWSTALLDEKDYLQAAVHALGLASRLAGTDYGTARQRDLGQLWTDAIRGFLGEIALVKWLKLRFDIDVELDYRRGPLREFLPSDIKSVNGRPPKLNISIKTTKLRGMWLDIPFRQIEHSDVFVLVRVGVTRGHLLAFLKKISAIKDKIFKEAEELGIVDAEELKKIWSDIPEFAPIPAYVAGFFDKRAYGDCVWRRDSILIADGEMKRRNFVVSRFVGYWNPADEQYKRRLVEVLRSSGKRVPDGASIKFEGMEEFSETLHFIVSSGELKRRREEWEPVIRAVLG
jgi:hypothetical protein